MTKKVLAKECTRYNNIYVFQDGNMRELWFKGDEDYFLQSRIDVTDVLSMNMIYSQLMLAALFLHPSPKRVLIVGLGGAILPIFLAHLCPDLRIDIVEIDSKVIEISKKYFFFKETDLCRVYAGDGRLFIQERLGKSTYDLVLLDAFKSGSVPYHLKTLQFYEEINRLLTPNGVVGSNLYGQSNCLKPHDLQTFSKVFRQTYLFEDADRIATALIASNQEKPWFLKDFETAAEKLSADKPDIIPWMKIAAAYKPEPPTDVPGFVFKDDFSRLTFKQCVEKNNLNGPNPRPYNIRNTYPAKS